MSYPLTPLRILLVEDHPDTAEIFATLLQYRGFRVSLGNTFASALDLARRLPFDLLLCDIQLPDGDGCDLLCRLRGELGMDALRAIAISGHGQQAVVERAQAAGFDAFVLKPVVWDRFFGVLEEVWRSEPPRPSSKREFITILTNALPMI
jgi:two-component system CheB/CheR fusion protein